MNTRYLDSIIRRYTVMKKIQIKKKMLSGVASVAKRTSSAMANQVCGWWDYQPKMPKSVKKMRKF